MRLLRKSICVVSFRMFLLNTPLFLSVYLLWNANSQPSSLVMSSCCQLIRNFSSFPVINSSRVILITINCTFCIYLQIYQVKLSKHKVMAMSPDVKERLEAVFDIAKTTFHWGFIPMVLYLGFKKGAEPGMPALSVMSLLWQ